MGKEIPLDRSLREDLFDNLEIDFSDLDSAFYEIADLDDKIMEYIKNNENDFYFDGDVVKPE